MITKVRFTNFASIKDSGVIVLDKINVLIGKNASGKSNFINALTLTRDLSRGEDINDVFPDIILSKRNLFYRGQKKNIEIFLEFIGFDKKLYRFRYEIRLQEKKDEIDSLVIPSESLEAFSDGNWSFLYKRNGNDLTFAGQKEIPLKINNKKLLFSYFDDKTLHDAAKRLKSIFTIKNTDLVPDRGPYVNISELNLQKLNHLAVKLKKNNEADFRDVQEAVKKIIPYFESVRVSDLRKILNYDVNEIENIEEQYLVYWRQKFSDLAFDSKTLSSGDQRTIYILFAMFYLTKGSTISIEEIENGIHIGRVSSFLDQIRTSANNRDLQIIISTHSREILNHIFPKEVIFCKLFEEDGTTYQRLVDNKLYRIVEEDLGESSSARDYIDSGYF